MLWGYDKWIARKYSSDVDRDVHVLLLLHRGRHVVHLNWPLSYLAMTSKQAYQESFVFLHVFEVYHITKLFGCKFVKDIRFVITSFVTNTH